MKKISAIILAAAVCAPALVQAQHAAQLPQDTSRLFIRKGDVMAGANLLAATFAVSNGYTYYNVGLSPRLGYFVSDRVALGTYINAGFAASGLNRYQSYGLGVFARYYLNKPLNSDGEVRKMRFFVEGGGGINYARYKADEGNGRIRREDGTAASVYGMGGFNYFLNKNVALEGALQYNRVFERNVQGSSSSGLMFNVGLQIFLGR